MDTSVKVEVTCKIEEDEGTFKVQGGVTSLQWDLFHWSYMLLHESETGDIEGPVKGTSFKWRQSMSTGIEEYGLKYYALQDSEGIYNVLVSAAISFTHITFSFCG